MRACVSSRGEGVCECASDDFNDHDSLIFRIH